MMSFVDIMGVVERDIAVSALAEFQRHVKSLAWQGFASALDQGGDGPSPTVVSRAIDGALELRMIGLLERVQRAGREGKAAVSMSPTLRAAMDRYARCNAIEVRRQASERRPIDRNFKRPLSSQGRIVRWGREFGRQALDRLKSWLSRMKGLGR